MGRLSLSERNALSAAVSEQEGSTNMTLKTYVVSIRKPFFILMDVFLVKENYQHYSKTRQKSQPDSCASGSILHS